MDNVGGYYGPPIKGYHRVNPVYPLSPTLFNVVVETSICDWVMVVAATEAGTEGLGC